MKTLFIYEGKQMKNILIILTLILPPFGIFAMKKMPLPPAGAPMSKRLPVINNRLTGIETKLFGSVASKGGLRSEDSFPPLSNSIKSIFPPIIGKINTKNKKRLTYYHMSCGYGHMLFDYRF